MRKGSSLTCVKLKTLEGLCISQVHIPHRARIQWHALKIVPYRVQTQCNGPMSAHRQTVGRPQTPSESTELEGESHCIHNGHTSSKADKAAPEGERTPIRDVIGSEGGEGDGG